MNGKVKEEKSSDFADLSPEHVPVLNHERYYVRLMARGNKNSCYDVEFIQF